MDPTFKRTLTDVKLSRPFPEQEISEKVGRSKILDSKKITAVANALKKGFTKSSACWFIGVSPKLFDSYMKRGREDYDKLVQIIDNGTKPHKSNYTIYAQLYLAVNEAIAVMQEGPLQCIMKEAKHDWRAAEAFLKRRLPDEWDGGDKAAVVVNNNETTTQTLIVVPAIAESKDEWNARVEERKKLKEPMENVIEATEAIVNKEKSATPKKSKEKKKSSVKVLPTRS